jgi:chromosomal replication initiator protein
VSELQDNSQAATDSQGLDIWGQALARLQQRIKPTNFDMWLRPIECEDVRDDELVLKAPNRYIKEWFEDNYLPIALQELQDLTHKTFRVSFLFAESQEQPPDPTPDPTPVITVSSSTQLNARYKFDSFVVGPSNALAHAAAQAVAEVPASRYNPLFIYGGVGLGKTHLLSAIGHSMLSRHPNFRLILLLFGAVHERLHQPPAL